MIDRLTNRGNFDDVPEAIIKRCANFQGKNSTNGIHRFSYLWKQFFKFWIWFIYLNHIFESLIWIIILNYFFIHLFELFIFFIYLIIYFLHLFESSHFLFLPRQKHKKFLNSTFCKQKWHVWGKNLKGSDRQHGWFDPLYCLVCTRPDPTLGSHSTNLNGAAWLFTVPPAYHRPIWSTPLA